MTSTCHKIIATAGIILSALHITAQNKKADSLFTLLKTDRDDTSKVSHLNALAGLFRNNDPDTCIYFSDQAYALASKLNFAKGKAISGIWKGSALTNIAQYDEAKTVLEESIGIAQKAGDSATEAKAHNNLGLVYYHRSDFPDALAEHKKALAIRTGLKDVKGIGDSYFNIGIVFYYQGNFPEALNNYFAALTKYDEANYETGMANAYGGLGLVNENQGKYEEALGDHEKALVIAQKIDDKQMIANCYNNIGNIYLDQHKYDEALKNYTTALHSYQKTGDIFGMAGSYYNMAGLLYLQGEIDSALTDFELALGIREKIGDEEGAANAYNSIGDIYAHKNQFAKAQAYLDSAKKMGNAVGSVAALRGTYMALVNLDSLRGDFKAAFSDQKLFTMYNDSELSVESRRRSISAQLTFNFEKESAVKEAEHRKELEDQKTIAGEKERKQNIVTAFIGGTLGLVLLFAVIIFRSLRITRKQKQLIQIQKAEVEERQREVTDSILYARRIQRSLLPSDSVISRNLGRLKNN